MGSGDGFVNMKISMSQRTIECSLKIQRASWYDRWKTEGVHADRAGLSIRPIVCGKQKGRRKRKTVERWRRVGMKSGRIFRSIIKVR